MKNRFLKVSAVVTAVAASATSAFATDGGITIDYSGVATGILAQVGTAITAALPVAGAIMGIAVAWKLYKKFAK